jgi:hypothetical protein
LDDACIHVVQLFDKLWIAQLILHG